MDTCRARSATLHRSAAPTKCPPDKPGRTPTDGLACPGAVSLDNAIAINIAMDGSTVNATNNYSVTLAVSAEQSTTELNIVNAAGGMIANRLNTAHLVKQECNANAEPSQQHLAGSLEAAAGSGFSVR